MLEVITVKRMFLSLLWMVALSCALGASACGDDGGGSADAAPALDAAADAAAPDATSEVTCRSASDCTDGTLLCQGPNEPNCGIPPREECSRDQDCGPDQRCHAVADACSADGVGSQCAPACTPGDATCPPGFTCGAEGTCEAVLCDQGFACRDSETCDPTTADPTAPVADRHHGCASVACQDDTPCPGDTVCVNGICQDALGTCTAPAP
jgi:hypothetical protein